MELREIREEQRKLREDFNQLREDFNRLSEEQSRLREDFNKMLEEIKVLSAAYRRLEGDLGRLRSDMLVAFDSLRKFAGLTFEDFVREMLSGRLQMMGILPEDAKLEKAMVEGEEINLFYENPLIVGEATAYAESVEEVEKFLRKARVAEKKYGRRAMLFLIILTAPRRVSREIKELAERHGIELIIGKEL